MEIGRVFGQFPVLTSDDGIKLQKIEDDHLNEVFDIYANDRVFAYCGIIPKHNKETVKSMIGHFERDYLKRTRIKWGIFAGDRLVGVMEAFDFNQKVDMVTIGYFLAEAYWGQGIATKALRIALRYLFEEVSVNRVQAEVMPANEASKKVLLKCGFVKEGLLRQASLWSGKGLVDLEIYGMLKTEYR